MMNVELVSIVLVSYNSSKYVLETLNSIFNQTYEKIELIVSDDCSTDETVDIIERWVLKYSYRFVSVKVLKAKNNRGTACNINKGIVHSKGEWIFSIAADDVLKVNYIEEMLIFFATNSKIKIAYSNIEYINSEGNVVMENGPYYSKFNQNATNASLQNKVLLRYNPVFAASLMFNKSIVEKYGLFDERFPLCEDLFFIIKITSLGEKIYYNPNILLQYRIHQDSVQVKKKCILSKYDFDYWLGLKEYAFPSYTLIERILFVIIWKELLWLYKIFHNELTPSSRLIIFLFTAIPFGFLRVLRIKYYLWIKQNKKL